VPEGEVDAHAHLTLAADRRSDQPMALDPDGMMAQPSSADFEGEGEATG